MANRTARDVRSMNVEAWFAACSAVISAGSAVTSQSAGSLSFVTITKPAGTGIYRLTFTDAWTDCIFPDATLLKAAGTLDADILPVAITNAGTATPLVVDFQVKKTSDGTAVDPVSLTILFGLWLKNSGVTP